MSYCRFSDNNFTSDVYIYLSHDGYMVHVASYKIISRLPRGPLYGPKFSMKKYEKWSKKIAKAKRERIGGKHDGMTYAFDTAQETIDFLFELKSDGYRIPDHAIIGLEEDAKEEIQASLGE